MIRRTWKPRSADTARLGDETPSDTSLSASTRLALELATQESAKLPHNYVGCEHLLLGLIAKPDGLAESVLRQMGLELPVTRWAAHTALAG